MPFNPADQSGAYAFTNGDRTATAGSGGNHGTRGTIGHTTGKWYLEWRGINTGGGAAYGIGLGLIGSTLGNDPPFCLRHFGGISEPAGGGFSGGPSPIDGHDFDMCFDLDASPQRAYIRTDNGVWFGRSSPADPVAGTGGFELTPLAAALYPMLRSQNNPTGVTLNTGDVAFDNSAPSGYSPWEGGTPDGDADGAGFVVDVTLFPGGAGGSGAGQTLTVTASLIAGGIPGDAAGALLNVGVTLLPGTGASRALDGSRIYETTFGLAEFHNYQEADYDSMWSKGRRFAAGLITAGETGWSIVFAPASEGVDNRLGNGPAPGSGPVNSSVWWKLSVPQDVRGYRFVGTDLIQMDHIGTWDFVGGFGIADGGGTAVFLGHDGGVGGYATEFDAFVGNQGNTTGSPTYLPGTTPPDVIYMTEFPATPRLQVLFDTYIFNFRAGTRTDVRFCNEIEFKIAHSNLDGGDRRSTNGRPEKRVAFSMSSEWVASATGTTIDPQDALFDGIHRYDTGSDVSKQDRSAAIGKSAATIGDPVSTVGAYLQFVFPRPVIMKRLCIPLFNDADGEQYDSGDLPTKFGMWHWEYSKNSGASWVACPQSWSFTESQDLVAPRDLTEFVIDQTDAGVGANGVSHWRMVLDQGPAMGHGHLLDQVIFDLFDATGLAPTYSINFTDDIDGEPIVFTLGNPGSPYVVALSDGSDDVLSLTFTNIPNPVLTCHFDDGGTFDTWSDLYPSMVVQTIVNATGR